MKGNNISTSTERLFRTGASFAASFLTPVRVRVKSHTKESLGKRVWHGIALVQGAGNEVKLQRGRWET